MAIRDRFRRALRKSDSSDSISQTESTLTTTSTASTSRSSLSDASSQQSHKSAPRLTRTFTFGHRDKEKDKTKEKEKKNKTRPHPSERPLTTQNLKHQELLSQFTMTFGTQNTSQIEFYDSNGISPCCTRPCSIDEGSRPLFSSVEGLSLED